MPWPRRPTDNKRIKDIGLLIDEMQVEDLITKDLDETTRWLARTALTTKARRALASRKTNNKAKATTTEAD